MMTGEREHTIEGSVEAGEREYTIDELALAAGLPTRTVRHYQSEGALPPPRRRGRIALYGAAHLERLRLIGRLQDRGLRLSAIRDALRQVERGGLSLEAWLGVAEQFRAPWTEEAPLVLTEDALARHLGDPPPGLVAALAAAGLVRRVEGGAAGTYVVPSPGLLDVALRLWSAGVAVETGGGGIELVRKQLRRTADELVGFFLGRAGKGFARAGTPEDLAEAVAVLRAEAVEAVRLVFAQEMERALRAAFDQGRPRFPRPAPAATRTGASPEEAG